jgi:uncharacterized membrane protein YdbT with pleckstrin-like domain
MGYVENTLANGEEVVHQAKLHWITFFWPIAFFVLAIVFHSMREFVILLVVFGFVAGIIKYLNFIGSEFVITNKRVVFKTGVVKRTSTDLLLAKVEGINVDQGILGRILGYGTIVVSGTGGTRDGFKGISEPLLFRKMFQEQADEKESLTKA